MEEVTNPVINWLAANWGWVVAVFLVFFEVTPIKLSPISSICKWFGNKITISVQNQITELKNDTDNMRTTLENRIMAAEEAIDMNRISNIRSLVLDFANSCRNGRQHSKEEFAHVFEQNDEYQELVKKYDIRNSVYKNDYKFIERVYKDNSENNSFLA